PWNIQARLEGYSFIVAASQNVIPNVADNVLAMTQECAQQHPFTLEAVVEAVEKAQHDLKQRSDISEVWDMLVDYQIIQFECSAQRHVYDFYKIKNIIRNFVGESAQPKVDDFIWLLQQMQKWENLDLSMEDQLLIAQSCIYQQEASTV